MHYKPNRGGRRILTIAIVWRGDQCYLSSLRAELSWAKKSYRDVAQGSGRARGCEIARVSRAYRRVSQRWRDMYAGPAKRRLQARCVRTAVRISSRCVSIRIQCICAARRDRDLRHCSGNFSSVHATEQCIIISTWSPVGCGEALIHSQALSSRGCGVQGRRAWLTGLVRTPLSSWGG